MLELIKLELQKSKFRWFSPAALIVTISVALAIVTLYVMGQYEEDMMLQSYRDLFMVIDSCARTAFIVYAAVLIARLVIQEYRSKTITVLFMYPVSRKKLLAAKLIIVVVWTLGAIVVCSAATTTLVLLIDARMGLIPETLQPHMLVEHAIQTAVHAVAAACMSLIPLFFGMLRKSVPATLVAAIIMVVVVNSNNGEFNLHSIVIVPLTLAAIGLFVAWRAIAAVDRQDVA